MMMAVAGRTEDRWYADRPTTDSPVSPVPQTCRGPRIGGLDYMKEVSVTVGRAGRLSVHTLDERALGMRGRKSLLPACTVIIGH